MAYLVTDEMRDLARVAGQQGLGNGVDFYIRGLPFTGQLGSELIGLSFDGQEYTVEHRRSDRTVEVQRSADFAASARRFLDEAGRVAAGFDPRRPHRPDPEPGAPSGPRESWLYLQLFGVGLIAGVLLIPFLVVLAILAMGSNGAGGGRNRAKDRRSLRERIRTDWLTGLVFGLGLLIGVAAVVAAVLALRR